MTKVSKSPERHTFQKEGYIKRCKEEGKEPNQAYLEMFNNIKAEDDQWAEQVHENDLEYDLRSTKWICDKAKASDIYAQNLYAAMCNMRFQKIAVIPILKEELWSCSWRSSGGIVADMLEKGDYIDWYCSGIRGGDEPDVYMAGEDPRGYVPEGTVTEEIQMDLKALGWIPVEWDDEK